MQTIMNRYVFACEYLKKLNAITTVGWKNHLNNLNGQNNEDEIIHKISLLNPSMYKFINAIRESEFNQIQLRVQGNRTFQQRPFENKCESKTLWGYDCPIDSSVIVYDHDFPYSLGGPTNEAYNQRLLCRWHNMVKSNDIHNYDWEALFIEYKYFRDQSRSHWIDEQLEKIKHEFNI